MAEASVLHRSPAGVERRDFDGVVVVGAGLAGLSAALSAAPRRTLVLSPAPIEASAASAWAQGGVAAALAPDDSPALHARDTEIAGAGLCDSAMVSLLTEDGPGAVRWLAGQGVPFDREPDGRFVLSLEAAHARPRVARVRGDRAGAAIMTAVGAAAQKAETVELCENATALALLQSDHGDITGVMARIGGRRVAIRAPAVILATGGVGGLYAVTTNPPSARGQGLAMAAVAGARIADPEFVQFHPTAIDVGRDPAPLATEALRGAGAVLTDAGGRRFMDGVHPAAELAPRDVVARAVHRQIASGEGAFLDARQAVGDSFPDLFPTVFDACMAAGFDPREQPIPIAPAAHYHMGGIATDETGAASLPGLYAVGECAGTGVHGANRLASNSLLEAVVFGRRAGRSAGEAVSRAHGGAAAAPLPALTPARLADLRIGMSRDAGVERDAAGLGRLIDQIDSLEAPQGPTAETVVAGLIARAALARRESRGAHTRSDFPGPAPRPERSFIQLRDAEAAFA